MDLVSIITPCYNASRYISQTIDSVLLQTYQNWEMIISDDCSTDNSQDIISAASKDLRIKSILSNKNEGPSICRNKAILSANGRYIAFLDSDDLWAPKKIEKQILFMKEQNCVLSFTAYRKISEEGTFLGSVIEPPHRVNYYQLLCGNVIGNLTAMYDVARIGKVYQPIVKHEDYAQWLNILKMGYEAYGLNECLAYYRISWSSVSGNKIKAATFQWKIYRDFEKLPLYKSMYFFIHYSMRGLRKSLK